jgi:hypothetical protein
MITSKPSRLVSRSPAIVRWHRGTATAREPMDGTEPQACPGGWCNPLTVAPW